MKFADRLKETTTATDTATITLTGAAAGCRSLAQVIAAGTMAVGDTGIPFFVEDAGGNWECGFYTITSASVLTRERVAHGSNGVGVAVSFPAGAKTVFNSAPASLLNSGLVNPNDPGFDIVICAGQSNMVGQDTPNSSLDIPDSRVFSFGGYPVDTATYQKITQAVDPLRYNYSQATLPGFANGSGLSPAQWFGKTYATMIPSNRKVLLVPVARAATYLVAQTAEWSPGDTTAGNFLYENAITQANLAVTAAKTMYPNSRVVGMIWLQGESDASWSISQINYAAALKTLIQGFRNRITGASNMWCVIMGMIGEYVSRTDPQSNAYYPIIDAAHRQVATEFPRCAYTPGLTGYPMGTGPATIHYTATGSRILGCNAASVVPQAMASRGTDTTAPTILRASVAATATSVVAVTLSEPFDPVYPPQSSAWAVSGHTVTSASGVGNIVYLTVSSPFVNGEAQRTVTFTAPGNGIRDLAGNLMVTQSPVNITNNAPVIDSTPPTLGSATVANATPSTLTMTASESLDTTNVPAASAFTVSGHTVVSVGMTATTVTLTLGEAFVAGEAARTVAYTQPGTAGLRDLAGNQMVSFSGLAVTNNAPAADTQPPTFSSAQIAVGTPTVVQLTMSETLSASVPPTSAFAITENGVAKTVSSVSVSGAVVSVTVSAAFSAGTTVQATYTAPGADPRIKDASNNPAASFGPVAVTNNTVATGTDLRLTNLVNMTETSATPPYVYTTNAGAGYQGTPLGGVTQLAMAGDGQVIVKLGTVSAQHMINFTTTSSNVAYNNAATKCTFMAKNTGYASFNGTVGTTYTSSIIPANNDWVRAVRSGSTVTFSVSQDNQQTWTPILQFTGVSGTVYCQMQSTASGVFTAPTGIGFA